MSKANILNRVLNKSPPVKQAPQTPLGAAGYDNPRENIDPHIKTKVVDALEFYLEGEDISDLFVNTSGGDTMEAPFRINGTNTAANVDTYLRVFEDGTEKFYVGNYFGNTGIVNPDLFGTIFFGVADSAGTIEGFVLCANITDITIGAPTNIFFNIGFFGNEATMTANNLTFNNGTTDTYIGWATNGQLDIGVSATSVMEVTASKVLNKQEMEIDGALNHDGTTVGFYGVTPVTRPSAYTQTYSTTSKTMANITAVTLTDSTTGTAVDNVQKVSDNGETTNNTEINDALASLIEEINALRVDVANVKNNVNSITDDLQSQGLLQ